MQNLGEFKASLIYKSRSSRNLVLKTKPKRRKGGKKDKEGGDIGGLQDFQAFQFQGPTVQQDNWRSDLHVSPCQSEWSYSLDTDSSSFPAE